MSFVLKRCIKANGCFSASVYKMLPRSFSDEKFSSEAQFSHSTIMVENGLNVHELPLVIRKLKTISEMDPQFTPETSKGSSDSQNYHLIQEEFTQCLHLRDVFSLLSKCTKITPNIALGAIERIYELEKNPPGINVLVQNPNINLAKGAILDKLLLVVMKTEDTQTILNILNTVSTFMDPYKLKFCDELLLRVIDNKLTIEQLCEFMEFLIKNKPNAKYSDTTDNLWIGVLEREQDINEKNIMKIFQVLKGFKSSRKTILTLLEQKFSDLWSKISVTDMQAILEVFDQEKYISLQSFAVVGSWLNSNIHALSQESMLDILSKLTRMRYTDDQVEKAVEKYITLKGTKIDMHVLIIGVLNYCLQFQIRNEKILDACCEYFLSNCGNIPNSFLKSFIYPFGYLNYNPSSGSKFWALIERILDKNFCKISTDDACSILLSFIYLGQHPVQLVNRLFKLEYMQKVNTDTMKKLCLIDTALSIECPVYTGPLLPKDSWSKPVSQDPRIKNILKKTKDIFEDVAGGHDKLSLAVMVPHMYSDETYLIDILIHDGGFGGHTSNWKSKSEEDRNVALLLHLPDHYCSDNNYLVGPQVMRVKQLKLLGLKVVSLKYLTLSQYYTSCNTSGFRQYLVDSIVGVK